MDYLENDFGTFTVVTRRTNARLDYDFCKVLDGKPRTVRVEYEVNDSALRWNVMLVDSVDVTRLSLRRNGITVPSLCYPEELAGFYKRDIARMSVQDVKNLKGRYFLKHTVVKGPLSPGVFTLPISAAHRDDMADYYALAFADDAEELWVCSPVTFLSEWRAFIINGEVVDVCKYRGCWDVAPSKSTVEAAATAWTTKPAGCCIDFGVTEAGDTVVIEVNDGYSLGSYGLNPYTYFELLATRWKELWSSRIEKEKS